MNVASKLFLLSEFLSAKEHTPDLTKKKKKKEYTSPFFFQLVRAKTSSDYASNIMQQKTKANYKTIIHPMNLFLSPSCKQSIKDFINFTKYKKNGSYKTNCLARRLIISTLILGTRFFKHIH